MRFGVTTAVIEDCFHSFETIFVSLLANHLYSAGCLFNHFNQYDGLGTSKLIFRMDHTENKLLYVK